MSGLLHGQVKEAGGEVQGQRQQQHKCHAMAAHGPHRLKKEMHRTYQECLGT